MENFHMKVSNYVPWHFDALQLFVILNLKERLRANLQMFCSGT